MKGEKNMEIWKKWSIAAYAGALALFGIVSTIPNNANKWVNRAERKRK